MSVAGFAMTVSIAGDQADKGDAGKEANKSGKNEGSAPAKACGQKGRHS